MNGKSELGNVEQALQGYVSMQVVRQRKSVEVDAPLVQSGLVDSLGLLQIIAYVEKQYGVRLAESGGPGDFRSIASLAAAVYRERGADGG
jgi:acyl carrier protein